MKYRISIYLIILTFICIHVKSYGQYRGGAADGFDRGSFIQSSLNIYQGGIGQGYGKNCFSQSVLNIYAGGSADGSHKSCFDQSSQNIYAGGIADGYAKECYAQPNPLKPVVQFTASDSTICVGTCINFTDLSLYTPYSWQWTFVGANITGSNLQNPTNICYNTPGNYTVTLIATNALGTDTLIKTAYIKVVGNPIVTVTPATQTICLGDSGTINLSSSSNTMSYLWSPAIGLDTTAGSQVSAFPQSNQTYNITATDTVYGCVVLKSAQVAVSNLPNVSASAVNDEFCEGGSTNLMASGAQSYSWSPVTGLDQSYGSVVTASPTSSTAYIVTGTNSNGCSASDTVFIVIKPAPVLVVQSSDPEFCVGGSSTLTVSGADSYVWSPSLGLNTANGAQVIASPQTTTYYTATGLGVNGCYASSGTLVTVNPLPNVYVNPSSATVCAGYSTVLNAYGADTYVWSPAATLSSNVGNQVTASPTVNTTYTVQGTDALGCINTANTTITMGTVPQLSINSSGSTVCLGESVTLQPSGAANYAWNPSTGQNGNNIITQPAGNINYILIGYNSGVGCADTIIEYITVNPLPNPATVLIDGNSSVLCPGGTIQLVADGAQQGVGYQWQLNGVDIFNATNSTYGATVAGVYSVLVNNAQNCTHTSTNTITIQGASAANAVISPAGPTTFCAGDSVSLVATSGANLRYQWYRNGIPLTYDTNQVYVANQAGSYTVDVTLNNLCTTTSSPVQVIINTIPVAEISADGPLTFCPGSSVSLTASSGVNYSYNWFHNNINLYYGAPSLTVSNPGNYTVIVTSGQGCTNTATISISNFTSPSVSITPSGNMNLCSGQPLTITANNVLGWSYQWYNGALLLNNETNATYSVTNSGDYFVEVVDSNNCSASSDVLYVDIMANPTAEITNLLPITFCEGGNTQLSANTGAGLTYQWQLNGNDINGAINAVYTANTQGNYTCKVTLNNNCFSISNSIYVTVNPTPSISITPSGNQNICSGSSLYLQANPETGLQYYWYFNNIFTGVTTATYEATLQGLYSVAITDSNNCSNSSNQVQITYYSSPTATISVDGNTAICTGEQTTLIAGGGNNNSTYQWNKDGIPLPNQTDSTLTTAQLGSYSVTITNNNGCSSTSAVTQITGLLAEISYYTPLTFCQGGQVALYANSGTGLSYQWYQNGQLINNATGQTYTADSSGYFSVIVTLNGNCSLVSDSVLIQVNPSPLAEITPDGPTQFCNGSSVNLYGNNGNYSYSWYLNGIGPISYASNINASQVGSYALVLTDLQTGCQGSSSISISLDPLPVATITPLGNTNICSNQQVLLQAVNNPGYSFQWMLNGQDINGATDPNYLANQEGTYTVLVSSNANCSSLSSGIWVQVSNAPQAAITTFGDTAFCMGGTVQLNANTGVGLTYQWLHNNLPLNDATDAFLNVNQSGLYSCIVTLNGNCADTSNVMNITVYEAPVAIINYSGNTTFCSGNSLTLNANTGVGLTYEWYLNGFPLGYYTETYNAVTSGNYQVKVTNSNACYSFSNSVNITVNPSPTAQVTASGNTNICPGNTVVLSAGNVPNYTYQWYNDSLLIPFATNNEFMADATGHYSVMITNTYNCSATSSSVFVYVNGGSNAPIYADGATEFCPGGTVNLYTIGGNGITYQWYLNGDPIQGAQDSVYTASQSGSYNVSLVLDQSCTSVSQFIAVDASGGALATIFYDVSPVNCTGDSIQLYTNTGINYTYQWFLNGSPIAGADSSLCLAVTDGLYTVSVNNGNGCSALSDPLEVVLNVAPSNNITFSGSTSYCSGENVWAILENRVGNQYSWYYQGGNYQYFLIPNANNDSLLISGSGYYYAVIQNGNCSVTTPVFSTHEYSNPTVFTSTSGNTNICPGQLVSLTAHAHGLPPFTYQWYQDSTLINNAIDSTYEASTAGNYSCVVINNAGCQVVTGAIQVYVNDGSSAQVSILTGNDTICAQEEIKLIATHGTGLTHQWFLNGDPILGATDSVYAPLQSGYYNCQVILDQNCTAVSNSLYILINSLPDVTLSSNNGNNTSICYGSFVEVSVPQNNLVSYQWYFNGNPISGADSHEYEMYESGVYMVSATNTVTGCLAYSANYELTVIDSIDSTISAIGNTTICENSTVTLSALASGVYQYQWYQNNNSITGANAASYNAASSGSYYCVISSPAGCSVTSNTLTVIVNSLPNTPIISGANNFCPNNQTVLDAGNGYTSYMWNTGEQTPAITIYQSGTYTVTVSNAEGCTVSANALVSPCVNNVPPTTLRTIDCGKTNLTPIAQIACNPVAGATHYEWEFSDTLNNIVQGIAITNWYIVTTQQVSPGLQWNTQYNCRVRAKVGGLWGNFSTSCRIGLRENPAITGVLPTQLRPQFCDVLNLSINSVVACAPVSMATVYEFEFTDINTQQIQLKQSALVYLPLNSLVPALQQGHSYSVRVRAFVYNTWSNWGSSCTIGIANSGAFAREYTVETHADGEQQLVEQNINEQQMSLQAYPNPFNEAYRFVIQSDENASVYVRIIDALGQIVWSSTATSNEYYKIESAQWAPGIYTIQATNSQGQSMSLRLVKSNN